MAFKDNYNNQGPRTINNFHIDFHRISLQGLVKTSQMHENYWDPHIMSTFADNLLNPHKSNDIIRSPPCQPEQRYRTVN